MNLSTYRKIQKFLLATFCVSVAALTMTLFIVNNPSGAVTTNTNGNKATPSPSATTANSVVQTNSTPANNTPVNTNSAANTSKPSGDENSGYGLMILGGVTFLTSITSLLGFISTTVLAWRKEKRDTEAIRFDNEKKELELEKLKWELEKIKSEEKASKPKRPRKTKKPE